MKTIITLLAIPIIATGALIKSALPSLPSKCHVCGKRRRRGAWEDVNNIPGYLSWVCYKCREKRRWKDDRTKIKDGK